MPHRQHQPGGLSGHPARQKNPQKQCIKNGNFHLQKIHLYIQSRNTPDRVSFGGRKKNPQNISFILLNDLVLNLSRNKAGLQYAINKQTHGKNRKNPGHEQQQ